MNEELEPLGVPSGESTRLSQIAVQHPIAAVAASVAVGAGLIAWLTAAASGPRTARRIRRATDSALGRQAELQAQFGKLLDRLNASLPSRNAVGRAVDDLSGVAHKMYSSSTERVKPVMREVSAAGRNAANTAVAHPLLTALALGAVGTMVAVMVRPPARGAPASTDAATDSVAAPANEPSHEASDDTLAETRDRSGVES